jgi:hypothetical protein
LILVLLWLLADTVIAADNSSLAAQTADPGAALVQLTFQETYSPSNHQGKGYSNEFQFQPVIPIKAFGPIPWRQIKMWLPPLLPLYLPSQSPNWRHSRNLKCYAQAGNR